MVIYLSDFIKVEWLPLKKILSIVLCLTFIFCSAVIVKAEKSVNVWSENIETQNNRLFDVEVYVDSSFSLTAVTCEILYDKTVMEYREANTDIANGQVRAADTKGKVKAIFLKDDGISANTKVKLFSAKFKGISEGSCDIKISMSDFVNEYAEDINYETSTVINVTVSGKAPWDKEITENQQEKNNQSKTDSEAKITTSENSTEKSKKYLSIMPSDDNRVYLVVIIVLVTIIMGLMAYTSNLKKGKNKAGKKASKDEMFENNTE